MTSDSAGLLALAAVADNAAWCEAVCRSLDRPTSWTTSVWAAPDPPRWFPHRITLTSQVTATGALAGLPDDTDCWVKDSYSTLELGEHGYTPVVHATSVHRPARKPAPVGDWSLVLTSDELEEWTLASGTTGVMTAPLLTDPTVRLVSVRERGSLVAGAVLSCGTDVIGVSNVFSGGPTPIETWGVVTAAAAQLFPDRDLVGYEYADDLEVARSVGFPVGALRIWRRPARSAEDPPHVAGAELTEQARALADALRDAPSTACAAARSSSGRIRPSAAPLEALSP